MAWCVGHTVRVKEAQGGSPRRYAPLPGFISPQYVNISWRRARPGPIGNESECDPCLNSTLPRNYAKQAIRNECGGGSTVTVEGLWFAWKRMAGIALSASTVANPPL